MRRSVFLLLVVSLACRSGRVTVQARPSPAARGVDSTVLRAIEPLVNDRRFRTAQWGIVVVDPDSGDTLYARNPGTLFVPASNQKIITGAVALRLLGPDFRFTTLVTASGPVSGGTLRGDLVLLGTGDPSMSDRLQGDGMRPLRAIADSLYRRGIRRITGRLVSGLDAFPDSPVGSDWAWNDLDQPYAAGVDELLLNEGSARLLVRGGDRDGDSVRVRTTPAGAYPRVRVRARTSTRGDRSPNVFVVRDNGDDGSVVVDGTIAPRDTADLAITFRNHTSAFLEALREALVARGIAVSGAVLPRPIRGGSSGLSPGGIGATPEARARPSPGPGRTVLVAIHSPPLRQILVPFEKNSVNQIGDALLKTVGRLRTGSGTFESGTEAIRRQLLAWKAPADGFVVRDGSGLSRLNLVSPETMVRVLQGIREDSAFRAFYDALPVAGIDGTLGKRLGERPARGNVRAKTGSLEQVRALSGYVTTASGRQLVFSIFCNNWTVAPDEVTDTIDEIVLRLARLRAGGR
jgi:D-alanyl-D-alanine carboxypeptidase/D-alanyl-D-alanine-endopeptidase (penicillin-binding protein 4)